MDNKEENKNLVAKIKFVILSNNRKDRGVIERLKNASGLFCIIVECSKHQFETGYAHEKVIKKFKQFITSQDQSWEDFDFVVFDHIEAKGLISKKIFKNKIWEKANSVSIVDDEVNSNDE